MCQGIDITREEAEKLWPLAFGGSAPFPIDQAAYDADWEKTDLFAFHEGCIFHWDEEGLGWLLTFNCSD